MKGWCKVLTLVATVFASLAQAQTVDSAKTPPTEARTLDLHPTAPIRWGERRETKVSDSQTLTNERLETRGTVTVVPSEKIADFGASPWLLPRWESEQRLAGGGFPKTRAEFEERFAPSRDYDNPFQKTMSQWFYFTNDVIFTWYGGFYQWQREFDRSVNRMVFGSAPVISTDESFWGQPRIKTKLDPSGASIRIDVPFGR
jgi:hypothetical protein